MVNPGARMVYVGKQVGLHTEAKTRSTPFCSPSLRRVQSSSGSRCGRGKDNCHLAGARDEDHINQNVVGSFISLKTIRPSLRCLPAISHLLPPHCQGGDPYVYGRGGEEVQYLASRGIKVHYVSGIRAAGVDRCMNMCVGASRCTASAIKPYPMPSQCHALKCNLLALNADICAELGIPMTHRGVATSAWFLTGHSRSESPGCGSIQIDRVSRVCWVHWLHWSSWDA